jgi:hypothetical protein
MYREVPHHKEKVTLYRAKAGQEPTGYDWGMAMIFNPYNGEVTVIP